MLKAEILTSLLSGQNWLGCDLQEIIVNNPSSVKLHEIRIFFSAIIRIKIFGQESRLQFPLSHLIPSTVFKLNVNYLGSDLIKKISNIDFHLCLILLFPDIWWRTFACIKQKICFGKNRFWANPSPFEVINSFANWLPGARRWALCHVIACSRIPKYKPVNNPLRTIRPVGCLNLYICLFKIWTLY